MFVSDIIIPARFLFTVAQLTGIIALLYDRDVHILKALPGQYAQDDWDSFDAEFGHALRSGMVFAGIEVLSITLIGSTLLLHRLNFVQMALHLCGVVGLLEFSINSSHFHYFWTIWGFFGLVPFLFEVAALWFVHHTKHFGNYW